MMWSAPPSAAHALAPQTLVGKRIAQGARIPPDRFHLALATIGVGLDHGAGEVPIALADEVLTQDKAEYVALFTDRRLLARASDTSYELPYPAIEDARANTGVVLDDLLITAWQRHFKLSGMPDVQPCASFLQAMLRVHPAQRVPPPVPLVAPTPDDPTGGNAARHGIWSRDQRILPLLGMGIEGHRKGWFSEEIGLDHVARAMHFDRTLAHGRGSREGWWTSPLGAPDLAYAFQRMLGAPIGTYQDGNARVIDFRLSSGGSAAGAAASTAVGLLALGVLGVGWVSTPGRSITNVRLKITPGQASTGFALFEESGALSKSAPRLVANLFEILPRIEGRMLIQRAAFGWDTPPAELDDVSMEALFRRVAEAIGAIEIGIFFPKPPPKR